MAGAQVASPALVNASAAFGSKSISTSATHSHDIVRVRTNSVNSRQIHLVEAGIGAGAHLGWIGECSLLQGVSAAEWVTMAACARQQRLPRRTVLCRQGEPLRQVSLLLSGRAKVTQLSPGGEEVILWLRQPGEVLGALGLAPGTVIPATIQATEPCHVLGWDAATFELLSERYPVLRRNAVTILLESLLRLQERFREMATENVASRLAKTLSRLLADSAPGRGAANRVTLSREELAQMTGTTLFTVSRLLSEWKQRGIVDSRRQAILVHDTERLLELADRTAAA